MIFVDLPTLIPVYEKYIPAFSFAVGVMFARYKDEISSFMKKRSFPAFLLSLIVFLSLAFVTTLADYRYSYVLNTEKFYLGGFLVLMMLTDLALSFTAMSFTCLICKTVPVLIVNPISSFIGVISLEVYALQGLILRALCTLITNKAAFAIAAASLTILSAFAIHILIALVKSSSKRNQK